VRRRWLRCRADGQPARPAPVAAGDPPGRRGGASDAPRRADAGRCAQRCRAGPRDAAGERGRQQVVGLPGGDDRRAGEAARRRPRPRSGAVGLGRHGVGAPRRRAGRPLRVLRRRAGARPRLFPRRSRGTGNCGPHAGAPAARDVGGAGGRRAELGPRPSHRPGGRPARTGARSAPPRHRGGRGPAAGAGAVGPPVAGARACRDRPPGRPRRGSAPGAGTGVRRRAAPAIGERGHGGGGDRPAAARGRRRVPGGGRPCPAGEGRRRPAADRPDPRRGLGRPDASTVGRDPAAGHRRAVGDRAAELPPARPVGPRGRRLAAGHRPGRRRADHRRPPAGTAHRAGRRLSRRPPVAHRGGSLHLDLLGGGGALLVTLTRRELEQAVRRGCPAHADGNCRCAVVERPPPIDGYVPTAAQRRWTRARDRQCRHPGCPNRSGWADVDHVEAYADGGRTDCANLCCLCRRHHRLKTHAPGWSFHLDADGALWV
ncbi:MAG: hypothetical protein AVDCRST_MAG52-3595, partial [uncultured Blastococcus sp.]